MFSYLQAFNSEFPVLKRDYKDKTYNVLCFFLGKVTTDVRAHSKPGGKVKHTDLTHLVCLVTMKYAGIRFTACAWYQNKVVATPKQSLDVGTAKIKINVVWLKS